MKCETIIPLILSVNIRHRRSFRSVLLQATSECVPVPVCLLTPLFKRLSSPSFCPSVCLSVFLSWCKRTGSPVSVQCSIYCKQMTNTPNKYGLHSYTQTRGQFQLYDCRWCQFAYLLQLTESTIICIAHACCNYCAHT